MLYLFEWDFEGSADFCQEEEGEREFWAEKGGEILRWTVCCGGWNRNSAG